MSNPHPLSTFLKTFFRLFIPAATQNLFFSLIGIFDVLMVGQLGDAQVAAVGLAGQFFFLLNITLFGISSGAGVFAAQYWGAKDRSSLHRVLGLCLGICLGVAALFTIVVLGFPQWVMGAYTNDPVVIDLGVSYLRIIGWSYLFTAGTIAFSGITRSTGNTRLPMLVSVTYLSLNTALDYCLIFGKLGLPAMGIRGAASGTAICRILECLTLLFILYTRRAPAAATPGQLFSLKLNFITHHVRLIIIVFLNEFFWALGVSAANALVARMGTQAYAAYNISATFQTMGLFFAFGSSTACGIMVGHLVGAGEFEAAYHTARRVLLVNVIGSSITGVLLIFARLPLMDLYRVSPEARQDAGSILLLVGLTLFLRSTDIIYIVGVMRSGGDTRYSAFLDVGGIWLIGIPAMAVAAFVFNLPVQWVFLASISESLFKCITGTSRFVSRRWMRQLTGFTFVEEG